MPHTNNKKPKRGNHSNSTSTRGRGQGRRQTQESNFTPFSAQGSGGNGHRAFTLQEEARNTERHLSGWDSDKRLRDTKVSFISAGSLAPSIPPEIPPVVDGPSESPTFPTRVVPHSAVDMIIVEEEDEEEMVVEVYEEPYLEESEEQEQFVQGRAEQEETLFFIDTQGNLPINTGIPPPRVSSPTPSNSSEEVILFAGRDKNGRGILRPRQAPRTISDPIDAKIRQVEKQIHEQEEILQDILHQEPPKPLLSKSRQDTPNESSTEFEVPIRQKGGRVKAAAARRHRTAKQIEEDALLADYMANMDSDFAGMETFGRRELGGDFEGSIDGSIGGSEDDEEQGNLPAWNVDDIEDFNDLSTSDGVMGEVSDVLSKRRRAAGIQYLIVWENQAVDEARWVPMTTLSSITALLKIEEFEAEEKLAAEFEDNSDDDSDDSDESGDDDLDVNGGPVPRKMARLSDEQIARMLEKQEELGMGGDELLLYNGEGDIEDDEIPVSQPFFSAGSRSKRVLKGIAKGKGKQKATISRARGDFPVASMLADAYDGFDVMDFERPSLQKKPKGRKGKLLFDLSDSSLNEAMERTYENDRVKKKERKQEREELRAAGLLGSKNGKPNMKQRYKEGMTMNEVKNEIRDFLAGDNTTLALPPMEKEERKIIHGIANRFKLKSKSDGSGKKRFPVLTKTQRTQHYTEIAFNAVMSGGPSRQFLPQPDVKGTGRKGARGQGGFNMASVSYREGDIVGGSAPALGVENRGRAMLEKMGWSTGDALGALNNKGILQPVVHIVKNSKAGLG